MITFISSKVSDSYFTLKSKVKKKFLRHVMQTFPFLFIIMIILFFILFCFTVQQIKRDVFKDQKEISKITATVNPYIPSAFLWVIGTQ